MEKINLSVPLSLAYKNENIDIKETETQLDIEFLAGEHTVTTQPVQIGTLTHFKSKPIMGQISFSYDFDAENSMITIYGTEFSSEDSLRLTTFLKDTSEYCHQRIDSVTTGGRNELFNANWNYTTHLTPNLEIEFVEVIKIANQRIIEAIKGIHGIMVRVKTPPPNLPEEELKSYSLVYKDDVFLGFYDANAVYTEAHSIVTIQSIWGGEATFIHGENFANVIGSTNDPKIGGSWINLWKSKYGEPSFCTSYQYNGFACTNNFVGGHVIKGLVASPVASGSDAVYITPICQKHNSNNNSMAALTSLGVIWLKNYMH